MRIPLPQLQFLIELGPPEPFRALCASTVSAGTVGAGNTTGVAGEIAKVKSGVVRRGKEIREGLGPSHVEMAVEQILEIRTEL